jgi:hypothetical protein
MKMSEYIRECQRLLEIHGDWECIDAQGTSVTAPEYSTDPDPAYVIADQA